MDIFSKLLRRFHSYELYPLPRRSENPLESRPCQSSPVVINIPSSQTMEKFCLTLNFYVDEVRRGVFFSASPFCSTLLVKLICVIINFQLLVYFHYCLKCHFINWLQFIHSFYFHGYLSFQFLPITNDIAVNIFLKRFIYYIWKAERRKDTESFIG